MNSFGMLSRKCVSRQENYFILIAGWQAICCGLNVLRKIGGYVRERTIRVAIILASPNQNNGMVKSRLGGVPRGCIRRYFCDTNGSLLLLHELQYLV